MRLRNNLGAETLRSAMPRRPGSTWRPRGGPAVGDAAAVSGARRRAGRDARPGSGGSVSITRYAYHHGHYDGEEREFRGFGMVEQWDTEALERRARPLGLRRTTTPRPSLPPALTADAGSTPVLPGGAVVSRQFAGEYYGATSRRWRRRAAARRHGAPAGHGPRRLGRSASEEEREALPRAAGQPAAPARCSRRTARPARDRPYVVGERTTRSAACSRGRRHRHAVFSVHPRETLTRSHDGAPVADRRIRVSCTSSSWTSTSTATSRGRRRSPTGGGTTIPIRASSGRPRGAGEHPRRAHESSLHERRHRTDAYRAPLPSETRTWEVGARRTPGRGDGRSRSDRDRSGPQRAAARRASSAADAAALCHRPGLADRRRDARSPRSAAHRADRAPVPAGRPGGGAPARRGCSLSPCPSRRYRLALPPIWSPTCYGGRVGRGATSPAARVRPRDGDGGLVGAVRPGPLLADARAGRPRSSPRRGALLPPPAVRRPVRRGAPSSTSEHDLLVTAHARRARATRSGRRQRLPGAAAGRRHRPERQPLGRSAFDALGLVVATAVMGKPAEDAGRPRRRGHRRPRRRRALDRSSPTRSPRRRRCWRRDDAPRPRSLRLLRYQRRRRRRRPACVATLARETHVARPCRPAASAVQLSVRLLRRLRTGDPAQGAGASRERLRPRRSAVGAVAGSAPDGRSSTTRASRSAVRAVLQRDPPVRVRP